MAGRRRLPTYLNQPAADTDTLGEALERVIERAVQRGVTEALTNGGVGSFLIGAIKLAIEEIEEDREREVRREVRAELRGDDDDEPPARALTVSQVAKELQVSERTVWKLIRSGALPSIKVGGLRRITRDALDAYKGRT